MFAAIRGAHPIVLTAAGLLAVAVPLAGAQPGSADGTGGAGIAARLEVATLIERLQERAGAEEEAPAGAVPVPLTGAPVPGDQLIYTVTFTNVGAHAATDIRITQPIPPGVRFVAGSATAPRARVLYSVDGGRSFGWPEELTVADSAGGRVPADVSAYTHVRWLLDGALEPGSRGVVRFRAVAADAP